MLLLINYLLIYPTANSIEVDYIEIKEAKNHYRSNKHGRYGGNYEE